MTSSTIEDNTNDIIVYITDTGEKYHKDGFRYLSKSKIPVKLSEIEDSKYTLAVYANRSRIGG